MDGPEWAHLRTPNGSSGYAQISCTAPTRALIHVDLAINGGFSPPAASNERTCVGQQDCSVETIIVCCQLASDYHHTRAFGIYADGHGNDLIIPYTEWKCFVIDPGMAPSGLKPGARVAMAATDGGAQPPSTGCGRRNFSRA